MGLLTVEQLMRENNGDPWDALIDCVRRANDLVAESARWRNAYEEERSYVNYLEDN